MSKASKDNGFLPLANELAEQFARRAFKAQELAILFVVMRETYGYKERGDCHPLTNRQLADATGIDFSDTAKHLKALVASGVLRVKDGGLGINPHLEAWTVPDRGLGKSPIGKNPSLGKSPSQSGEIPHKNLGKSPRPAALKPSDTATPGDPKEKKETIKETLPPTGVPKLTGLAAIANETDWGEGEQARFLSLIGIGKLRNLSMLQGKTAEQVQVYLAFSADYRARGWAYLDARLASENIDKPLGFLVGYLQDPSKYPAAPGVSNVLPGKVVPMRPAREEWEEQLLKGKPQGNDHEIAESLYDRAKVSIRWGYQGIDANEVWEWTKAIGAKEAGRKLWAIIKPQIAEVSARANNG